MVLCNNQKYKRLTPKKLSLESLEIKKVLTEKPGWVLMYSYSVKRKQLRGVAQPG